MTIRGVLGWVTLLPSLALCFVAPPGLPLPFSRISLLPPTTTATATEKSSSPLSTGLLSLSFSSSDRNNDSDADDELGELAKLIGKRNQIKRKPKARDEIEATFLEPTEPVVDLDLDKLPEFRTERPVIRRSKQSDDDNDKDDSKSSTTSSAPIIDYLADYDDENDFHIPNRIVVSTIGWGEASHGFSASSAKLTKAMIKAGRYVPGDIQLAHTQLLEAGLTVFETAPTYGAAGLSKGLSALDIVQRCIAEQPTDVPETRIVMGLGTSAWTTLLAVPLRPARNMVQSLDEALARLETPVIDLFALPKSGFFPSGLVSNALVAAIESGQCNFAGVTGVTRPRSLSKLVRLLKQREVTLTTNMFPFSLTNRKHEKMIEACKTLGVIPLIEQPLDRGGLASGVFTATNPSGGGGQQTLGAAAAAATGAKFTFAQLEKLQPLHSVQETLTDRVRTRVMREMRQTQEKFKRNYGPPPKINTDITTTQIALNYVIAKGGVPVVPVNTPKQAEELKGCLGWSLTDEEVSMLDAAADLCKT